MFNEPVLENTHKDLHTESLLQTRKYYLFWFSSLLSNIGTWMQQIAQPWVMLSLTQSSFMLGLDSFAMNAPGWLLTLWGGSLADHLNKKKIIIFFQSIQFVAIISLVVLLYFNQLSPWYIIFISFIVGTTDSLSMPAFQTIIPSLVKPNEIPRAISLNSIQFNLSRTLGPAIAGIMLAKYGALICFEANAISFIPFFLSIFWIFPKKLHTTHFFETTKNQELKKIFSISSINLFQTLKETLIHADLRQQILATFITSFFFTPLITFTPLLIKEIFNGTAQNFGHASSAFGVGGLIGALMAYLINRYFNNKTTSRLGLLLALLLIGISFKSKLAFLFGLMFFGGLISTLSNIAANSQVQLMSSNDKRGQLTSLFQLSFRGGIALGAIVVGATSAKIGIANALLLNGTLALIIHASLLYGIKKK